MKRRDSSRPISHLRSSRTRINDSKSPDGSWHANGEWRDCVCQRRHRKQPSPAQMMPLSSIFHARQPCLHKALTSLPSSINRTSNTLASIRPLSRAFVTTVRAPTRQLLPTPRLASSRTTPTRTPRHFHTTRPAMAEFKKGDVNAITRYISPSSPPPPFRDAPLTRTLPPASTPTRPPSPSRASWPSTATPTGAAPAR